MEGGRESYGRSTDKEGQAARQCIGQGGRKHACAASGAFGASSCVHPLFVLRASHAGLSVVCKPRRQKGRHGWIRPPLYSPPPPPPPPGVLLSQPLNYCYVSRKHTPRHSGVPSPPTAVQCSTWCGTLLARAPGSAAQSIIIPTLARFVSYHHRNTKANRAVNVANCQLQAANCRMAPKGQHTAQPAAPPSLLSPAATLLPPLHVVVVCVGGGGWG